MLDAIQKTLKNCRNTRQLYNHGREVALCLKVLLLTVQAIRPGHFVDVILQKVRNKLAKIFFPGKVKKTSAFFIFLVADTRLYTLPCRSVGR